jgi:hypothetical protein
MVNGVQTFHIFSTTDQAEHARMKRPLAKFFSVGHVLALEPHMDTVVNDLIGHIDKRFVNPKKNCNLGEWVAFCKSPRAATPPLSRQPLSLTLDPSQTHGTSSGP